MKVLLRVALVSSFGVWMLFAKIHPPTRVLLPEAFNSKTVSSTVPLASEPVLRYVAGSTVKVEQLVGEEDKQITSTDTQSDRHAIRKRRY